MKTFFKQIFSFTKNDEDHIVIPRHNLPALLGAAFLLQAVLFGMGFYWGKQKALGELMAHVEQESFADKVFSSLCALYEVAEDDREKIDEPQAPVKEKEESAVMEEPEIRYFAKLAGFGSEAHAQAYASKLMHEGVDVLLKEHTARSARGLQKKWYQIETKAMKKDELDVLVTRLAQRDKLRDISIMEYGSLERQNA